MDNPYQSPKADVRVTEQVSKLKWKIFFWLILALEVAALIYSIPYSGLTPLDVLINFVIYPIVILGLFGFAYDKRLFFRGFWIFIMVVGIACEIYHLFTTEWGSYDFKDFEVMYIALIGLVLIVMNAMLFFQYLALFKYGFKSPNIWKN